MTKIEWTDEVWNPTVGCTPVSAGCAHCYAKRIYERFHAGQKFSDVHCYLERLNMPWRWKKPRRVFVDSMSDLFHEDVPDQFIAQVFAVMAIAREHTFQILTKRPERFPDLFYNLYKDVEAWQEQFCYEGGWCPQDFDWPLPNVWLGVSIENQETALERIPFLLKTPAAVRFVSVEPMLNAVDISCFLPPRSGLELPRFQDTNGKLIVSDLDWVICGCESGPSARLMYPGWVRSLRDQCQNAGTPFFLKQMQGDNGRIVKMPELDGRVWAEYPVAKP